MKGIGILAAAFSALLLLGGCKDYSDELDDLRRRIDGLVEDLGTLKEKAGDDPVQAVTFEEGYLRVTTHGGGTVSYEIGPYTKVFEMKPDGMRVMVNGEEAGTVAGSAVPERLDMQADGTVVADGVPQSFRAVEGNDLKKCIVFIYDANGNVTAVKVKDGETFIGLDVAALLAPSIASVVHIPAMIDGTLGAVEFFPVIARDEYSAHATASPVFSYNGSGKLLHETYVPGWLTMNFLVNPANVDPAALGGYAFDHRTTYVSVQGRGAAPGLEVKAGAAIRDGVFRVQVRGLRMMKWSGNGDAMPGSEYDDPRGNASETHLGVGYYQADQLSLQLTNRHANGQIDGGVVASPYIGMKRLVVSQKDIEIGLTVAQDGTTAVSPARDLHDLYTDAGNRVAFSYSGGEVTPNMNTAWDQTTYKTKVNDYKKALPALLDIPYAIHLETNNYDLSWVVKSYFTRYHTNLGHDSSAGQYDFVRFGFDAPTCWFALEPYDDGTTVPGSSDPVYSAEEMAKYITVSPDGKLSVTPGVDYAEGLEPILRVSVRAEGGDLTVKLLKIRIAAAP